MHSLGLVKTRIDQGLDLDHGTKIRLFSRHNNILRCYWPFIMQKRYGFLRTERDVNETKKKLDERLASVLLGYKPGPRSRPFQVLKL